MKRTPFYPFIFILSVLFTLICFTLNTHAAPKVIPKAPAIAAKSYILIDHNSGKIIAQENADVPMAPASITKVMTAYVVFSELKEGNIQLDELVTVSKKAWKTEGSRMFLDVGKTCLWRQCLRELLLFQQMTPVLLFQNISLVLKRSLQRG